MYDSMGDELEKIAITTGYWARKVIGGGTQRAMGAMRAFPKLVKGMGKSVPRTGEEAGLVRRATRAINLAIPKAKTLQSMDPSMRGKFLRQSGEEATKALGKSPSGKYVRGAKREFQEAIEGTAQRTAKRVSRFKGRLQRAGRAAVRAGRIKTRTLAQQIGRRRRGVPKGSA